jgi:hypothetical protein
LNATRCIYRNWRDDRGVGDQLHKLPAPLETELASSPASLDATKDEDHFQ